MAFDGIITKAVVYELNNCILNGKINKIFEPNKNEILLGIYSMGKNYALNISIAPLNYRINLTTHIKANPKNVLNFCMILRKHLIGGTIKKIYMKGLERIVYIDIECFNELNDLITKTLVIELMGKHSNIILIDKNKTIIDSLRHLDKLENSKRDILPGYKYLEIENNKKNFEDCTYQEFCNIVAENNLSKTISDNFIGISKLGIEAILRNLQANNKEYIYTYLKDLLKSINENKLNIKFQEFIIINKKDFYIINSKDYSNLDLNFAIDDYYYQKENEEEFKNKRNTILNCILSRVHKLEEKLKTIEEKLKECKNAENYKLYGELITANLYKIENYNKKSVILENYYKNNEKIQIPLDSTITPSENAKKYFKKYKKLQNTKTVVSKQRELIKSEIEYLESIVYNVNSCYNLEELEEIITELEDVIEIPNSNMERKTVKKELKVKPTEYKIDGFTVYVGKNNKQNDYLTCKMARNKDIWFHTKDIHGSHVVLKVENKNVPDSIIYKCATIAAYFSKAKMSQNVPVDYTFIKYVRKPNGAKPGMVIYTDNKTLYVNPKKPE